MRDSIYSTVKEVRREAPARYADVRLREAVLEYVGANPLPDPGRPIGCLARSVATVDYEFLLFLRRAALAGLPATVMEFREDTFVLHNRVKFHLGKLYFYGGKGKHGGSRMRAATVVDLPRANRKKFSEIYTVEGESLVSFHHRLLKRGAAGCRYEIVDCSPWLASHGGVAVEYYPRFLSLFLCFGVLFEDFLLDSAEGKFTSDVVLPSLEVLKRKFGLSPLILPISGHSMHPRWFSYPQYVEGFLHG